MTQLQPTRLLLNPKLPEADYKIYCSMAQRLLLKDHVLLASSGTSGERKLMALSHEALECAAKAVNQYIQASSKDVWALALPLHHIGGFSITVRAKLSGSKVAEWKEKWSAAKFVEFCATEKVTLTSLVPTQVWDLVRAKLQAPKRLRAVFVGGAALDPLLYERARQLGWALLPCYGMTETCAQVACARLDSIQQQVFPVMHLFSHVLVQTNGDGRLSFKGPSLLTCMAVDTNGWVSVIDPTQNGWFLSEDFGEVHNSELKVFGRGEDFIKIAGEAVSLLQIQSMVEHTAPELVGKSVVLALDHDRHGSQLVLVTEEKISPERIQEILQEMDRKVLPVARLQQIYFVKKMPTTSLEKIKRAELRQMILPQNAAELLWKR